jgi:hypothetical protein
MLLFEKISALLNIASQHFSESAFQVFVLAEVLTGRNADRFK